jgi:hypothetical protein
VRNPASRWPSILASPDSANQAQEFAGLRKTCHGKGVDTPYPLLHSGLEAMRSRVPDVSFITVTGDPSTALLRDYEVVVASNQTGIDTIWSEEYDYAQRYHQTAFSAAAVTELIHQFSSDPHAETQASQEYIRHYFKGDLSRELTPCWPQYVCSLESDTAQGYAACVCAAVK